MKVDCFPDAPGEWSRGPIEHFARVSPRYRLDPSREYPFIEMANVAEQFNGIIRFDWRKPEGSGLARFKLNDILFGKITPCAENGKVALVKELAEEFGLGSTEFIVLSTKGDCDPRYLYSMLCSGPVHGRAVSRMEGSTGRLRITEDTFTRWLHVAVPSPKEQRAVAAILDAADAAIERTREAVGAVERLKRALMQELLPPWIGFKRIPDNALGAGIESHLAGSVCRIKNGSTPSRMEYWYWNNGTIPWLATGKVNERIIRYADEFVTEKALAECSIELLPAGTVLIGMIGQGRTRGMAAYLDMSACINQNFGAFIPGEKVVGKFLYHYFCFHYDRLRDMGGGTNQGALNCYILKRIRLALPKPEVQKDIARVLDGCDALIEKHNTKLNAFQRLKRGLMQDLLTGKVRVPVSLEAAGA